MSLRDTLRAHKDEGQREWAAKEQAERERLEADAAAKKREEQRLRELEAEKHRRKAEEVLAKLPDLVRSAAAQGLESAVLADSFLEEKAGEEGPSRPLVLQRKTYYLKGWLIPFCALCEEQGIPLTVHTERVDVGLGRILHRSFHLLAIDLKRL